MGIPGKLFYDFLPVNSKGAVNGIVHSFVSGKLDAVAEVAVQKEKDFSFPKDFRF